jgi:uncharacterized protein DUF4231
MTTTQETKAQLLHRELDRQIGSFEAARKLNKRRALAFKLSITGLGSLTTVVLGFQSAWERELLHNVALVLSAIVTLLSAWDSFFNHRALWVRYTTTASELKALRAQLAYITAANDPDSAALDHLFTEFQTVLKTTNEWWLHQREAEEPVRETARDSGAAQ